MKHLHVVVFLISSVLSIDGMESDAFIPAVYKPDKQSLDEITQREIMRRIDREQIDKGVKKYIYSRYSKCTKEEEDLYIKNIKEKAIENKVKKSILTYLRQNMYVSNKEEAQGQMSEESDRWEFVVCQINSGILVFDEQGKLVKIQEAKERG